MAFAIEKLTVEQKEAFAKKNIPNPLSPTLPVLCPVYWTIDAEKEAYLFEIGTHRDFPDEVVFFYSWKEIEFVLSLKAENRSPNTRIWSLASVWKSFFIAISGIELKMEMKADLKLALHEHKLHGTPDPINMSTTVICDF